MPFINRVIVLLIWLIEEKKVWLFKNFFLSLSFSFNFKSKFNFRPSYTQNEKKNAHDMKARHYIYK